MNSLRKSAEDYYNFILKYDECFYNKYPKEETEKNEELLKFKTLFNEMLEEQTRPYKTLTKGKEIEEIEYIFSNDSKTFLRYLKIFDYLSDECYDLAEKELKEYYAKNNIKRSHNEIIDILTKYMDNNTFDSKIFSQELIEKCNLMNEADEIYERLTQIYKNMKESN